MKLLLPFLILALALVGSVLWDEPQPRGEVVISYTSIETLDPQITRASEDVRLAYALFEGLCAFDAHTLDVMPGVAERWEVNEEGTRFTFHLRHNARWSDGQPLTAHDFAYAWRVGLLPDTAPYYIEFLQLIRGGKAYTDWATHSLNEVREIEDRDARLEAARQRVAGLEPRFREMVAVEVVDDHTLVVESERFIPYFLDIMATWPLFPLPRHVVEPLSEIGPRTGMIRRSPQWIKADTMVTNGPFYLHDWRFRREIYMKRNPHYWNADQVAIDSLQFLNFSDPSTIFIAYESGLLDLGLGVESLSFMPDLMQAADRGERDDVHAFDGFGTYYYALNMREDVPGLVENPMRDPRVRKAMTMAVNRRVITENVTRMRQRPTTTFVPPGSVPDYPSPAGLAYAPDRARELLADAGWRRDGPRDPLLDADGRRFPRLTLTYNTAAGHQLVAQAVARMWASELGIDVRLENVEWPTFLDRKRSGDVQIARGGWFGDYMDPTTFLDLFRSGNPANDSGMADEHYDQLLDDAEAARDPQRRLELLAEAERYLIEEAVPIVPIYIYNVVHLYEPERLRGVSQHPRNLQMFGTLRVVDEQRSSQGMIVSDPTIQRMFTGDRLMQRAGGFPMPSPAGGSR